MGLMDRDYWRDRYNKRTGSSDPTHWREDELAEVNRHEPGRSHQVYEVQEPQAQANELSFIGKFFTTIFVMLICAITYRYLR